MCKLFFINTPEGSDLYSGIVLGQRVSSLEEEECHEDPNENPYKPRSFKGGRVLIINHGNNTVDTKDGSKDERNQKKQSSLGTVSNSVIHNIPQVVY